LIEIWHDENVLSLPYENNDSDNTSTVLQFWSKSSIIKNSW
jgi:hypothetical protein